MIRFTETDKWKDPWFRKLKPSEKLLWIYILDNCDNAGFLEFDIEFCCFMTGMNEQQIEGAIKGLDRGLTASNSGNVYFVNNFLRHQKNDTLNSDNNAHKQIIRLVLEKDSLFGNKLAPKLGLNSPIGKGKGKGNSNGTSKVTVKEPDEYSVEFEIFWKSYPNKKAKVDAYKAWNQMVKLRPVIDDLLNAINTQKKSTQWKKDGGQYIPKPASWLRAGSWADEIEPEVSQSGTTSEECAKILKDYGMNK